MSTDTESLRAERQVLWENSSIIY